MSTPAVPVGNLTTFAAQMSGQPFGAPERSDERLDWARYFTALWRFKFLILFVVAAGSAAGFYFKRLVKPEYTSEASVFVTRVDIVGAADVAPVRSQGGMTAMGWISLPRSLAILDNVVEKLHLYIFPLNPADTLLFNSFAAGSNLRTGKYALEVNNRGERYTLWNHERTRVDSGVVGDSIGRKLGFQWAPATLPANREIEFTLISPRDVATDLQRRLVVTLPLGGNIMSLQLTGSDPESVTRSVNGILDEFVDFATKMAKRTQTSIRETLYDQLLQARADYDTSERALSKYAIATVTEPTERNTFGPGGAAAADPIFANYQDLRAQRGNVARDAEALENILTDLRMGGGNPNALRTIESVRTLGVSLIAQLGTINVEEQTLAELLLRDTEASPEVQRQREKLNKAKAAILPAAEDLLQTISVNKKNLEERLTIAEADLKGIPERTITIARLQSDVDIRRGILGNLESEHARAQMAEGSAMPDVTVMVRARAPVVPSSAPASRIFAMVVLVAIALAVALAILLDRVDKRLRYKDQVTRDLGLLILGTVPRTRRIRSWQRDSLNAARIVESFRSVRLALSQAFEPGQPITVAVSSPGPGEGKSLVSENLALAFADGGYRTLLIDGDTRRGELHATFGVERRGGLLDHLAGRVPLHEAIRKTGTENLWILPGGTRFKRGPELLMTPAMQPLMTELKARFDAIIIDTPPLSAGVDAFVFGTTVGNMLLVLRNGKTDRKMAEAKLDLMDRLPVRIIGAVINDVRGATGYEYYSYIDAYGAEEEGDIRDEEVPSLAAQVESEPSPKTRG